MNDVFSLVSAHQRVAAIYYQKSIDESNTNLWLLYRKLAEEHYCEARLRMGLEGNE